MIASSIRFYVLSQRSDKVKKNNWNSVAFIVKSSTIIWNTEIRTYAITSVFLSYYTESLTISLRIVLLKHMSREVISRTAADRNSLRIRSIKTKAAGIPAVTSSLKHGISRMGTLRTIRTLTDVGASIYLLYNDGDADRARHGPFYWLQLFVFTITILLWKNLSLFAFTARS